MSNKKLLVAALALAHLTCASVPLTAPSGSSLSLNANPMFVAANGGTSALTAVVVEPAGTFVPDGTVVFFLTNLGRVDAEAKTKDGFARATFVADSRSGKATIIAFSGGSAPAPTASPTRRASAAAARSGSQPTAAGAPVTTVDAITSTWTSPWAARIRRSVVVTADPPRITEPRNSQITANVVDDVGNPVVNVPVIFTIDQVSGGLFQEALDSGSQPRYTDTNGQARDTLRTSQNRADPQKTVVVSAIVPPA